MGRLAIDLAGAAFGLLTVLERDMSKPRGTGKDAYWLCRCACGQTSSVRASHLKDGTIRSCGCREGRYKHGMAKSKAPEYVSWMSMRRRCQNPRDPAYVRYGGRGIGICAAWEEFAAFYAAMGPKPSPSHSLDRINNNGDYEPGNCRWATREEQGRNKRTNKMITHGDKTLPVSAWAEVLGIPEHIILSRSNNGWTLSEIIRVPTQPSGKHHVKPK